MIDRFAHVQDGMGIKNVGIVDHAAVKLGNLFCGVWLYLVDQIFQVGN